MQAERISTALAISTASRWRWRLIVRSLGVYGTLGVTVCTLFLLGAHTAQGRARHRKGIQKQVGVGLLEVKILVKLQRAE
jgi:hypothetical protein